MNYSRRIKESDYMYWARQHAHARYHLASSGLTSLPASVLSFSGHDLELTHDSFYGFTPLLEAIAAKENVHPDRVFATLGTSLANHIAMAVSIDPGDEVLIEHPTYELLISTAQYLGASIKRFHRQPEDNFQIDPLSLRKACSGKTRLIVITNLHNPSSAYTDEDTIREIGRVAESMGAAVIVDEVYLDARFHPQTRSAVHLGPQFISTNSLTKVYGLSGLRCGWVIGEPDQIRKMWRLNDLYHVNLPHPTEQLSVLALNNLEKIRATAQSILKTNHRTLGEFLVHYSFLQGAPSPHGTVFFPHLEDDSVDEFVSLLYNNYETSLVPGRFFEMPNYVRIGLGVQPEEFHEGMVRLGDAHRKFRSSLKG